MRGWTSFSMCQVDDECVDRIVSKIMSLLELGGKLAWSRLSAMADA